MARVLVVDDEKAICDAFRAFLTLSGHESSIASNGKDAIDLVRLQRPDVVFLDVQMPGMTGLEALKILQRERADLPVIIMTAYGTMQTAIEAVREGAFDYVTKPVDLDQIRITLRRALDARPAAGATKTVPLAEPGTLIGNSAAMQEVFKLIGLLTTNDFTVLLTGESGVGKEVVAQAIHNHSDRKAHPFVAINCAAIPETLIDSELFGHERGAFTGADSRRKGRFELAEQGTLFLDEIGELPLVLQGKLLRVLQEKVFERVGSGETLPVRARIITATNRDLSEAIAHGHFREDLYYRLKLISVPVPALRQRRGDISLLAYHFLALASAELNRVVDTFDAQAEARLNTYLWPGNVRELEHCVKRAALICKGGRITLADLDLPLASEAPCAIEGLIPLRRAAADALRLAHVSGIDNVHAGNLFHHIVQEVEHELVDEALRLTDGNQVAAARLLGLHRTTMRNKRRDAGAG